jgi:pimeloyl-ACP methyl ester carboxylesterase
MINLSLSSPYYSLGDNLYLLKNMIKIQRPLFEYLYSFDIHNLTNFYKIPVFYLVGEKDVLIYDLAQKYYEQIDAPYKKFITIPETGHLPMLDNPQTFSSIMIEVIAPIIIKKE